MQTRHWWQCVAAQMHDCVSCLILCLSLTGWLMLPQRQLLFFSTDSLFLTTVAPWPLASKTIGRKSWLLSRIGTSEEACKEAWGSHTHTLQGFDGSFYVKTFGRLSTVLPKVAPVGRPITTLFTQPWNYDRMRRMCVIQQKTGHLIIWLPTHQLGQYLPVTPPFQPDTILILLWNGNIHNRKAIMRLCEKCNDFVIPPRFG